MLTEPHDEEQIIARVAALDIGKAELVCCVRVPGNGTSTRRLQEVTTHATMSRALTELANHLIDLGIERVVMEATSDYWKPVFYLLEAHGLDPWLVNARDVKHLPGRPKTDVLDSVWLCKVAERQMLRPSFVPPRPIRQLRDLIRYRSTLVVARTAEKNRVEKLLEDALYQTLRRRLRHLRSLRAGHDGRPDRGTARPEDASAEGAVPDAHQDRPPRGGTQRALR